MVALGRWDIQKSTLTWTNRDLGHAVIAGFDTNKFRIMGTTINRVELLYLGIPSRKYICGGQDPMREYCSIDFTWSKFTISHRTPTAQVAGGSKNTSCL
jgi:hypothetical protein